MDEIKVGEHMAPREEFLKWIQALRSGEYKQCKYQLNNSEGFCCLGVACKVLIPQDKLEPGSEYAAGYIEGRVPAYHSNAPRWLKHINGDSDHKLDNALSQLNDVGYKHDDGCIHEQFTFDEIADILEAVYIEKVLE